MSAFRAGHSWPTGNGGRSWVSYPLWFVGIGWLGGCWLGLLLLPWRIILWLGAEELLLFASLMIIVFRLIRRDHFRIVVRRLPYGLIAFDTV